MLLLVINPQRRSVKINIVTAQLWRVRWSRRNIAASSITFMLHRKKETRRRPPIHAQPRCLAKQESHLHAASQIITNPTHNSFIFLTSALSCMSCSMPQDTMLGS